jgi:predicted O-linked N-acetylglucosamine transferase (SPINDLY family)
MVLTIPEALRTAVEHHQAGRLAEAEQLYRRILQEDPREPDALHLLGVLAHQAGRDDLAVEYIGQALGLRPAWPQAHDNLGAVLRRLGRLEESAAHLREALRLRPGMPTAHFNLALTLVDQGRPDDARAALEHVLALAPEYAAAHGALGYVELKQERFAAAVAPYEQALRLGLDSAEVHNNLGYALQRQGKLDEAVAHYEHALRLQPGHVLAHANLGFALTEGGKPEEGLAQCLEALRLGPSSPEAHNTLALTLHALGRLDEALDHFDQALRLRPDFADAHNNLGTLLKCLGRLPEAEARYREALRCRPGWAPALTNLGNLAKALGRFDEAMACYRDALRRQPDFAAAHTDLAIALADEGRTAEAEEHFREASRLRPRDRARLPIALLLPVVYESPEDVRAWRRRLVEHLAALHRDGVSLDVTRETGASSFYLAYQGLNDRDVQRDLARLYAAPAAAAAPAADPAGKIRVGFVSRLLRNHTIGRLMRGLIARLARDRFHVSVLPVGAPDDPIARAIQESADRCVVLPDDLPAARRLVAALGLDVLFYTDIGMEPFTDALALTRLAPVQCATWGHPVTTGMPTVDYFISAEDLETEGAEGHYTETLVRLKALPIYYHRPELPAARKGRADLGLPGDGHLYGCPQSLFKFHPEFDDLLGRILRADPGGYLVLLRAPHPHWEELLLRRFARTMPDVLGRVLWVPRQDPADFLGLNAALDVLLDPIHFGGGNTSYEALALGVPIVTLPSAFLRGRITYALYRQMGVLDCVAPSADEYVALAVRLGTDPAARAAVSGKIRAACGVLYENAAGVRELEEFLRGAVAAARSRTGRENGCRRPPIG